MSKSYLRNKYMCECYKGQSFVVARWNRKIRNKHRQDEMPKNVPPKHIIEHIDIIKVAWLQEPGSFGGHKPRKGGHRMVSGIVRAKVKKAHRKFIDSSFSED